MQKVTAADDPRRCQRTSSSRQCDNLAIDGSENCAEHSKNVLATQRRQYLLTEVRSRQRLAHLTQHDSIEALRDVIALAVRLVERRFNTLADNEAEFLSAYYVLNDLLKVVQRLKKSATTLERSLTALLSRNSVEHAGQRLIDFLQTRVNDPNLLTRIDDRIQKAIDREAPRLQPVAGNLVVEIEDEDERNAVLRLRNSDGLRTLTEEIGLQIILVERLYNATRTELDLLKNCGAISKGLANLEGLIKSAHEMEKSIGNLLSVESLNSIGAQVGAILNDELGPLPGGGELIEEVLMYVGDNSKPDTQLLE